MQCHCRLGVLVICIPAVLLCAVHIVCNPFRPSPLRKLNAIRDDLNCCGKMPSLRKARLPGLCNLPEQLGMSPSGAHKRFSTWLAGLTDARENLKKLRRQLGLGNNKSPACAEPVGPSTTVDFYRHQGDRSREVDPCSQGRMLLDLLVGMHCSRWVVPGSVRI